MGMWVCVCRAEGTMWEDCANRIIRTSTIEKAILLVTDPEKMTQEELARQVVKASTLHPKPEHINPYPIPCTLNHKRPAPDPNPQP